MARILIAEDDRAILLGLSENLAFDGHVVVKALRGDEALELHRVRKAGPPDPRRDAARRERFRDCAAASAAATARCPS